MRKYVPCGKTLGHGESCTDRYEGGLCDSCVRIKELEAENQRLRDENDAYEKRESAYIAQIDLHYEPENQRLREAAEQVVFECEADDDAMMPSVAAVFKLRALLGGRE